MKKWECTSRIRISRIVKKRFSRSHKKNQKRAARKKRLSSGFTTVIAPVRFTIINNSDRTKLTEFVAKVRDLVCIEAKNVLIDFSQTNYLHVDGALLFYAEIKRIKLIDKHRVKIRCLCSRNNKVSQVFTRLGIYRLFNESSVAPHDDDVVYWRVAEGMAVEGQKTENILGKQFDSLRADMIVAKTSLYAALTEAMQNSREHAYTSSRKDGGAKDEFSYDTITPWWMFSQIRDNRLSVGFVDLGAGIPATLNLTDFGKGVLSTLKSLGIISPKDSEYIKESIKHSRSRTGQSTRGKGLTNIHAITTKVDGASLHIFSNKGLYSYDTNEHPQDFNTSIYGTMVIWTIPL